MEAVSDCLASGLILLAVESERSEINRLLVVGGPEVPPGDQPPPIEGDLK